jgi:hypothetical protein
VLGEADRLWPDLVQDFAKGKMKGRYHDPDPIDLAMEFAQFSLLTPLPGTALFRQFEEEQRIVHRDWSKYDLGSIVFNHPLLSAERLHFEKNHAWRRFYSIRSMIRRLGLPKTRGDLILWIANLAVKGALVYRWGREYRTWKGEGSGLVADPLPVARSQPRSYSWHSIINPFKAVKAMIPGWINVLRAVSSSGFDRIRYYEEIRRRLDVDRQFRRARFRIAKRRTKARFPGSGWSPS